MRFELVKQWVHARFACAGEGESFALFDIDGVRMRVVCMASEGWIALAAVICDDDRISLRDALHYNRYRARVGALALENGRYQLRQLLPVSALDEAAFGRVAVALASEVLRLARSVRVIPQDCDEVFASYSE